MKTAIIGLGKMGKFYDNLLKASYVVDTIPVKGRAYFTYVDELIHYHPALDLVIVSTPINTHFQIVKKLLNAHYNVLCEKPLCLSFEESRELEQIAQNNENILYQSTLERYNPTIKFAKKNIKVMEVKRVESYRFGARPQRSGYSDNPMHDLGIHDIDLALYLFNQQIPWEVNAGYGEPRREIILSLKNKKTIKLDLLNKLVCFENTILDIGQSAANNPILEMILDLEYRGRSMNEKWSEEIKLLTKEKNGKVLVCGDLC